VYFKFKKVWKRLRRPRIRFWRKGWRHVKTKRFGRKYRFVVVYRGKLRRILITRRGLKIFRRKRWRRIFIRKPHKRRTIRLIRRLKRRSRRVLRRITRRLRRRIKRRRRRPRRLPIKLRKIRRPRIIRCGVRVRINRKWKPVLRYKRRFWVRYHKRRRRISFRKTKFRIFVNGRWRRRPTYRRIKVLVNRKYRYIKKTTRKGIRTWITKCYGRTRRIKLRRGRRIMKTKTTWTRITRHVRMRVRISGKLYPAVRRGRQWYLKDKKKYRLMILRGRGLRIRYKKKWKTVRGSAIQVRYGKQWRSLKQCCKILRLRVMGRSRRISLRNGGLKIKFGGRRLRLGQIRRRLRHLRRKVKRRRKIKRTRRRRRRGRRPVIRRRKRRFGFFRRLFGKKNNIPKAKENEPVNPHQG
jgi:hypothetical protein